MLLLVAQISFLLASPSMASATPSPTMGQEEATQSSWDFWDLVLDLMEEIIGSEPRGEQESAEEPSSDGPEAGPIGDPFG